MKAPDVEGRDAKTGLALSLGCFWCVLPDLTVELSCSRQCKELAYQCGCSLHIVTCDRPLSYPLSLSGFRAGEERL